MIWRNVLGESKFLVFPHIFAKISWMERFRKRSKVTIELISRKKIRWGENFAFFYTVKRRSVCWNCRNFLSHFFSKNSVKAMALPKKLLNKYWFDKNNFSEREFLVFHTVKRKFHNSTLRIFIKHSVKWID